MVKPTVVGRYAIYDRIAAGGMATVHIGRLLGQVGFARTVAIKRLHPQYAMEPEFVAMFLDEARLAARIRHPNVVPTLDVVAMEGELFLVMEYVQGESLSRLLGISHSHGERILPAHVSSIVSGVLHGLHAAHEAKNDRGEPLGIVHRDVSPQNVLVGSDGITRVLDFGIARAIGQIHTTREGQVKGKFAYMAPEQLQGAKATPRTDVFAAGILLWEALAGRRLFKGETEAEIVTKILQLPIQPPSAITPLPGEVDDVVMRALERDPASRFESAEAMAIALEDALAPSLQRKVAEWVRRTAADELSTRTELVTRIESSADAPRGPFISAVSDPELTEVTDKEVSQFSSISVETGLPPRKEIRSWRIAVAVGALSAVVIGAVLLIATRRGDEPRAPIASATASTAPMPASPPIPPPVSAPVAVVTQAPTPIVTSPPIATRSGTADAGKAAPIAAIPTVRPHPTPTPTPAPVATMAPDASLWAW